MHADSGSKLVDLGVALRALGRLALPLARKDGRVAAALAHGLVDRLVVVVVIVVIVVIVLAIVVIVIVFAIVSYNYARSHPVCVRDLRV